MKLIKPHYEIIEQEPGLSGIYKAIEQAGRTCYKSEDKITDTSAKEFVDRMIKSGHLAMLEFGTVYLKMPITGLLVQAESHNYHVYDLNKYSKSRSVITYGGAYISIYESYITTNYRVIVENGWLDDLRYLCDEPTEYHEKRICVRFTTDRGVSHELVRHRVFSFAQESTRYCNYSKDKFDNELTFIVPSWVNEDDKPTSYDFMNSLKQCECGYLNMLSGGYTPQQARQVLPNALKTEINMCGFTSDWNHFFNLRDNPHAHPDMQALTKPLHKEIRDERVLNAEG